MKLYPLITACILYFAPLCASAQTTGTKADSLAWALVLTFILFPLDWLLLRNRRSWVRQLGWATLIGSLCACMSIAACGQTTGPAIANTHPLMTTDYSCKEGGRLAVPAQSPYGGLYGDVSPATVTVDGKSYQYVTYPLPDPPPVCVYTEKAAAPADESGGPTPPFKEDGIAPEIPSAQYVTDPGCITTAGIPARCPPPVPAPAKPETPANLYFYAPLTGKPKDGCVVFSNYGLDSYDAKTKTCSANIFILTGVGMPRVSCTLTRSHGEQRLTCWYRPIEGKAK